MIYLGTWEAVEISVFSGCRMQLVLRSDFFSTNRIIQLRLAYSFQVADANLNSFSIERYDIEIVGIEIEMEEYYKNKKTKKREQIHFFF